MKEQSYMIILPRNPEVINTPQYFMDNMKKSSLFRIVDSKVDREEGLWVKLEIDGRTQEVVINHTQVQIPEFIRLANAFTKSEMQQLGDTKFGLSVSMNYDLDPRVCFYDQLRIMNEMIPDILGVLDCPSEKLLSGKWVKLAAQSHVLPAPRYLFTVQAVSGSSDEVWLHSHGLKRCGMFELEVLCSDKENYHNHYDMIEQFAIRMLEAEETIKKKQGVLLAQLMDQNYLVATAVDWKEALEYYPEATLGTAMDRDDDVHNEDTCPLMIFKSPMDEKAGRLSTVQEYNEYLTNNPMYLISNSETERMSRLAQERIEYLRSGLKIPESKALVKIALTKDKQFWEGDDPKTQKEHIWFEVKEMGAGTVTGVLTQEPYWVASMKPGDVGTYPFSDVTDWLIFTKERRITTDDAYMLEL